MLSERQLQNLLKVFEERMQDITEDYLTRMGQHLRDIGRLTDTDVHRVIQMKRVNKNLEHIKARIARAASMSIKDVERVFEAVAESDYRFAATTFGEDHAPRVKDNKYLERIIKAQLRATAQEFKNLSQTTIMSEGYKNAVDVAVQTVQAGLTDYNSAIRKAMKAAAQEGLRVQYPNSGLTRRLDTAIRQNVLDGIRSINQDVLKQAGKEFGADGVEISAHALCAQDHLPYQGRQFEQKEFDRLQNNLDRPFGMWNCKHTVFPILVGISEPAHTEEELQAYIRNSNEEITIDGKTMSRYEWTQHQRKLETAVRYQKDIAVAAKAAGDMIARREAQVKINRLTEEYAKISDAAGLIEKPERMRVSGFSAVKPVDQLKKIPENGKITPNTKASGDGVNFVCKIDKKIYSCVTKDIVSDDIIITDERIDHIKARHPNDFERFAGYMKEMAERPHYIIEDEEPNTAFVLREFEEGNTRFRLIIRIATSTDDPNWKNSILTFQYVKVREYNRLIRNKKHLYKNPDL